MRGIKFRAFLRFDDDGLLNVGTATAVKPAELVDQIRERRDKGEIEVDEESEVWIIPAKSLMKRTAVATRAETSDENGRTVTYKHEQDLKHGETYVALTPTRDGEYRIEGYVRAIEPEMAARLAASLRGGRMDAKNVVIVPEQTVNRYTVGSS